MLPSELGYGLDELGYGPFMLPQHSLGASSALLPVDCYLRSLFMTGVVSGISWFPFFRDSRHYVALSSKLWPVHHSVHLMRRSFQYMCALRSGGFGVYLNRNPVSLYTMPAY